MFLASASCAGVQPEHEIDIDVVWFDSKNIYVYFNSLRAPRPVARDLGSAQQIGVKDWSKWRVPEEETTLLSGMPPLSTPMADRAAMVAAS
jgi:hypothetical protein